MSTRETFRQMDILLRDWLSDADMTTAEYVCVQFDLLIANQTKRLPLYSASNPDEEGKG